MPGYDLITVGGGLGGAALALAMAERGYRVLVVEKEERFRDRVRGESLLPWGAAEARELGIHELLKGCGHEPEWWDVRVGPASIGDRNLAETTPGGMHAMTFYHPEMQERLLEAAAAAGAEVRRGVRVSAVRPGSEPAVDTEWGASSETATARLVVGADGRGSPVRKWAGFEQSSTPHQLQIGGILLEDSPAPEDRSILAFNPFMQRVAILFPQAGRRVRAYFANRIDEGLRLQGEKDYGRFVEECVKTGMPAEYYEGARPAGPLATFPGVYEWVEHPYQDGVALVGDAACTSDPTWGQGLSLTLRSVRELRDALLADDDWERAGRAFAERHAGYWRTVRVVEGWFTELFFDKGREPDARRGRAFAAALQDQTRFHDCMLSGPDAAPADEAARRRMFAED